jgi:hypothetical protein
MYASTRSPGRPEPRPATPPSTTSAGTAAADCSTLGYRTPNEDEATTEHDHQTDGLTKPSTLSVRAGQPLALIGSLALRSGLGADRGLAIWRRMLHRDCGGCRCLSASPLISWHEASNTTTQRTLPSQGSTLITELRRVAGVVSPPAPTIAGGATTTPDASRPPSNSQAKHRQSPPFDQRPQISLSTTAGLNLKGVPSGSAEISWAKLPQ